MIFEARIMREERSFQYVQAMQIYGSWFLWLIWEEDISWEEGCHELYSRARGGGGMAHDLFRGG